MLLQRLLMQIRINYLEKILLSLKRMLLSLTKIIRPVITLIVIQKSLSSAFLLLLHLLEEEVGLLKKQSSGPEPGHLSRSMAT